MGTTPTYSWPYPETTGLVKDGWEDIKDLATAIDTTAASTFGGGLVKISTTTITSGSPVSAQNFNNVFNSTYANYRIVANIASNQSDTNLTMRMRVSGTDNSTASAYVIQSSNFNDTSISGARVTSNLWTIQSVSNTQTWSNMTIDIFKPFLTEKTLISGINTSSYLSAYTRVIGATHNQATSYDGFSLTAVAGTFYGDITVYGYKV